jgi:phosphoribosylanthranilate isomerase
MFKVKICGITTPEDALLAADAGADAIGLNFYEKSPRYVTFDRAKAIWSKLLEPIASSRWNGWLVGVYVNADFEAARNAAAMSEVGNWQLHGDEPSKVVAGLSQILGGLGSFQSKYPLTVERFTDPTSQLSRSFNVIKAFRCNKGSLDFIHDYLRDCQSAGSLPHAILLDAHAADSYGGTGQTIDWNMIREQHDKLLGLPLILAGGLTPDNVAEAIAVARPDAVDVASGVESSPGKKDPARVRDFVATAKEAFARLDREKPK